MKSIAERVAAGERLVSDGAWGTMLQARGLEAGQCPELWCIDHPDRVLAVAAGYIEAGADLIQTNSFGANRFKLEHYGLAERTAEFNRAAAALSRRAAGPDRGVIASVGPTGKMLLMGDVTEEQLYDCFVEQVVALRDGGADAACIETMSAADEACCAIRAAKDHTDLEIICTFTFDKTLSGEYRTMMGISPADAAEAAVGAGAHIIGANCGNGIGQMIDIVAQMRAAAPGVPILVHANAGVPQVVNGAAVFPQTPEQMSSLLAPLLEAGAGIIGGCCGTTPAHIRALRDAVDRLR